jgi:hypothetical protein
MNWHKIRRHERNLLLKVFLPVSDEEPILAIGMEGYYLSSLARSWTEVHVYKSNRRALDCSINVGKSLDQEYRLIRVKSLNSLRLTYPAVAIRASSRNTCNPDMALRLVKPGGSVVWLGPWYYLPSKHKLTDKGYCDVRRYAVLPPRKDRLLLGFRDDHQALAALDMFTPLQRTKQIALRISRMAVHFGAKNILGVEQMIIADKPGDLPKGGYFRDWLCEHLGIPIADANVFAGWSKMVLQLFDRRGKLVAIAKVADVPFGIQAIKRESLALERISRVPEMKNLVPALLANGEWGGCYVQIQTAVGERQKNFSTALTAAHLNFLKQLSQIDASEGYIADWPYWSTVWRWAHEGKFSSRKQAEAVRIFVKQFADKLGHRKITFHRVHGDFVPWHIFLSQDGLRAIDWENSHAIGLPLSDAVSFVLKQLFNLSSDRTSIDQLLASPISSLGIDRELDFLSNALDIFAHREMFVKLAILFEYMLAREPSLRWHT